MDKRIYKLFTVFFFFLTVPVFCLSVIDEEIRGEKSLEPYQLCMLMWRSARL